MNNKFFSRKFLIAIATLAAAFWLRLETLIEAADFVKLAIAVLALYGTANVAQKALVKDDAAAK